MSLIRLTLASVLLATLAAQPASAQSQAATPQADAEAMQLLAARTKGSAAAPITVYEMSDFQCPYCRGFALETYPLLEEKYVKTGKVRWVFIHFPITSIHKNAAPAAEVSMCAARAGKFWPMHDVIFRTQKVWSTLKEPGQFFQTLADSVGMPRAELRKCAASGAMEKHVALDAAGADRAGANSTPTFYIEGGLLQGAQRPEVFSSILDSIYTVRTAAKR